MAIKISSLVKLYIILLLSEKPKHGYELMKQLEIRLGKKISPNQIYPFLNLLQKESIIHAEKKGVRDKVTYTLTKKGEEFTKKMLSRAGDLFYLALKPHLTACTHCGCKILEGGHKEVINKKELTFCCHHCAKSFKANR